MMMARKQQHFLHELLSVDQEPFQLKSYIADRRRQLKDSPQNTQIQPKKRKPISQNRNFPSHLCKNACFFSFQDSPAIGPTRSPLFEFPSPAKAKSPCRSPNAIFLHIPARTAALLLEAALRIQKQSSKQKNQSKSNGFGLFGSIRRKLTNRNRVRKRDEECGGDGVNSKVSVKDLLRWESSVEGRKAFINQRMAGIMEEKSTHEYERRHSCSCSGVWSENNDDRKSLDLDLDFETSCSSQSQFNDFEDQDTQITDFPSCEKRFCESPFHFVLQTSPSTNGCRTPDFSSPAASPIPRRKEDKENHGVEIIKNFQDEAEDEQEEEEEEQCSPVSVLDPPFVDDGEGQEDEDEDGEGDGDEYDHECSYALVQRAKKQLLHKLRRFEKLAELDPIELEKRILEQEQDDSEHDRYGLDLRGESLYYESTSPDRYHEIDEFVKEVLSKSSFHHVRRIPEDMKRLVMDLIAEEEREQRCWSNDKDVVVKRVCRRLESWHGVESNTIDMMVEQDLRTEHDGWERYEEQVGETALDIELAIFGLLVEEFSDELVA